MYLVLVLGIVLKWGFHPSKVIVLTQFASARHRALGNGRRLLSFSRFIIRSSVNSEIFWPGWRGNRKQSKSWIGTTTHQNFMIILIYTLLQRENLLTCWCVVYHDEDQRSIIVYYDGDQTLKINHCVLRWRLKINHCVLQWIWCQVKNQLLEVFFRQDTSCDNPWGWAILYQKKQLSNYLIVNNTILSYADCVRG